jgi:hypothetical protein
MADRIQLRRDTSTNWSAANPVLASGEQGFETDTLKLKIGNGVSAWNSLAYVIDVSSLATSADVTSAVNNLIDAAPGTLDTLNELAAALGDDANFASTVTSSLALKADTTTVNSSLALKADTSSLATVATSGAYADVTGTPSIPSALTDLSITDGTVGQVLTTDGSGGFTFDDTSGGGSFEAVASGTLANGDKVVVNADGTVSVVAVVTTGPGPGAETRLSTGDVSDYNNVALYDPTSNKVIITYGDTDNSNYITFVVGTVGTKTITFGTPVALSTSTWEPSLAYDPTSNKVVVAFFNPNNSWTAYAVGTVSGNSISFGSVVEFYNGMISDHVLAIDTTSNKVVLAHTRDGVHAFVGTISGNSISFGSSVEIAAPTGSFGHLAVAFDSNSGKMVFAYHIRNNYTPYYGRVRVGTVSGNSITLGSELQFNDVSTENIKLAFDSNANKIVMTYNNAHVVYTGWVRVGTVSGNSISFGTAQQLEVGKKVGKISSAIFNPNTNKVIITYSAYDVSYDDGTGRISFVTGTVSGTSINLTSPTIIVNEFNYSIATTVDTSTNQIILIRKDSSNHEQVSVVSLSSTTVSNLTSENFVGISDGSYASGATATIQTSGAVDDAQSGLTAGQAYFLKGDGTIITTPDTPRVFAGVALSATELMIGKDMSSTAVVPYTDSDVATYLAGNGYDSASNIISTITDSAPATLDTLNELAAALGDDANFAGTVTTSLAAKANTADLATVATTGAYADVTGTPSIPSALTDLSITDGTVGQVLTTDGSGGFTFADTAGGSFEAVASGTLANGDMVVINATGTVSVAGAETTVIEAGGLGTEISVAGSSATYTATVYDSNSNKVVVIYGSQTENTIRAYVGTVSGKNITFGNVSTKNTNGPVTDKSLQAVFDPNSNKVVVAYVEYIYGDRLVRSMVGTISGTSISFGSQAYVEDNESFDTRALALAFDSSSNKVIFSYISISSKQVRSRVGTVSGTSISFGSVTNSSAVASYNDITSVYDPDNNKVVVIYRQGNTFNSIVGTVSGTGISFGSEVQFVTGGAGEYPSVVYDTHSNKVVFIYRNDYGSGRAIVGTVSGTSINFGAPVIFESGGASGYYAAIFDPSENKVVISYQYYSSPETGRVIVGTVSGTSISFNTPVQFSSQQSRAMSLAFDSNLNRSVISWKGGKAIVFKTEDTVSVGATNLTSENFVGVSDAAYSDGATATIQTAGAVDDAQSGLTAGQAYFLQEDGTLGTTADTTRVFAGVALSATELMIGRDMSYTDSDVATYLSGNGYDTATNIISTITDSAPATLDTLNELAAALGDDANFAGTVTTSLAAKANTADLATVATSGSYNDLTDQPVIAAGGGGSFEAVASGSLSDGSTSILNADGTVSAVGVVESPGSLGTNYPSGPDGAGYEFQISMYDSTSGKTVIIANGAYPDYIGTISLTTFNANGSSSYTPISLPGGFDQAAGTLTELVSIGNGKFVLVYYSNANSETRTVVGTISGDTITWGTAYVVTSGYVSNCALIYYASEDKVILLGGGNFRVGTVSGTDITFGAPTATPSSTSGTLAYFPNRSKAVYIYSTNGATSILFKTFTLDSSGNITLGSTMLSDSIGMAINAAPGYASFYHTGLNKFVFIGYNDSNRYIVSVVLDIDEYGQLVVYTPKTIHSGNPRPSYVGSTYDPNINTYAVYWMSNNADNGPQEVLHIKEATIDSNTYAITTGPLIVSLSNTKNGISKGLYIPEIQKSLIVFGINAAAGRRAAVWTFTQQVSNLTAENYAGIADAVYADAATATIQTAGSVDDAQSGLTPGQAYYVQGNGTLGLNPATPSVFAGTAVSATKLLIGKEAPAADLSSYASTTYVDTAVSNLVDTAPEALNTLNELAAALGDDANFAGTVTTSLTAKANTADLATVATTGAYSDLTGTPAAVAPSGSFEAVASGTLANGDKVVVNADGTVSVISATSEAAGSSTTAVTAITGSESGGDSAAVYDSNSNKVVLIQGFNGSGWDGGIRAVVGTVSGGSITFGTSTVVFSGGRVDEMNAVFDSNSNKVVVMYRQTTNDPTYYPEAMVLTVSGNSISAGGAVVINSGSADDYAITFDSTSNKVVFLYRRSGAGGVARVGTVSGSSVSIGSEVIFTSNVPTPIRAAYDPIANKVIVVYRDATSHSQPHAYRLSVSLGTISGSSISFGSQIYATSARVDDLEIIFASNSNKLIVFYKDTANSNIGTFARGTVSGSTINFTTTTPITASGLIYRRELNGYDAVTDRAVFTYYDSAAAQEKTVLFVVSTGATIDVPNNKFASATFDSVAQRIVAFNDTPEGFIYSTVAGPVTSNLTSENFVGIADGAYASGATATIQTAGAVDDAQSGLTAGQAYFVQANGTIATTPDSTRVFAGVALSATELMIGRDMSSAAVAAYTDSDVATYLSGNGYDTATNIVATITDSAPGTLDTLNELAAALGDDANFASTVTSSLALKADIRDTVYALTGTALDRANGGIQTKTLAANTTFTDSLVSGDSLVLQLEAGASYTVTWPTMQWVTSGGNVAPTLTAKDTLVFWKVSSTLYGAYTGSYV